MGVVLLVLLVVILAFIVLGWAIGLALNLLWFVLVGGVIGALARLVLPGEQPLGILATILFGIAGSLLGGLVAEAFDLGGFVRFLVAIAVAAALIAMFGQRFSRRAPA